MRLLTVSRIFVLLWLTRFSVHGERATNYTLQEKKVPPCYNELKQPQYCTPPILNLVQLTESFLITDWNDRLGKDEGQIVSVEDLAGKTWISKSRESQPPHSAENKVTLTVDFERIVEISSLTIKFDSPRPHSFVIYRKDLEDGDWLAYQYFSANCTETYELPDVSSDLNYSVTPPFCTSNFTQRQPRRGGKVSFSPSQVSTNRNWAFTTALSITIDRPNIPKHLLHQTSKYSYSISNVTVLGRLDCNGHGKLHQGSGKELECVCMHFTMGTSCQKCLNSHNDAPWLPATKEIPTECKPCNCGNYSSECYFDEQLYELTGHGGHCKNCTGNRNGTNCEICIKDYYMKKDECVSCGCNTNGTIGLQCNSNGECPCQLGYNGTKCDQNIKTFNETTKEAEHQNLRQNATTETSTDLFSTTESIHQIETFVETTPQTSTVFPDALLTTPMTTNFCQNTEVTRLLYEKQVFTDLILVGKTGKRFRAHKTILATQSPVIFAKLMNTTGSACNHTVLEIEGISDHGLEALLELLYFKNVDAFANNLPILVELYSISGIYKISHLYNLVREMLLEKSAESFNVFLTANIIITASRQTPIDQAMIGKAQNVIKRLGK